MNMRRSLCPVTAARSIRLGSFSAKRETASCRRSWKCRSSMLERFAARSKVWGIAYAMRT